MEERVISVGAGSFKDAPEPDLPEAPPDGYAEDDEFREAYGIEKPRWVELAERLK